MKKRLFCLIVAAVTAVTLLGAAPVFAAEPAVISTAEQLLAVQKDGDYILGGNVDLSGSAFDASPIPEFAGTLDGNGYTITGLDITVSSGRPRAGLIGMLTGTVKNLVVEGNITVNADYARAGGIAATSTGTVQNCRSNVAFDVNVAENAFIGGVAAYNFDKNVTGTVKDCYFGGSITVSGAFNAYVGGISCAYGTIIGCVNEGDVTVGSSATILTYCAGVAAYEAAVSNCVNSGNVTAVAAMQAYAGGVSAFAGSGSRMIIQNCKNTGAISASISGEDDEIDAEQARAMAGGISAYTANVSGSTDPNVSSTVIRRCANSGAVSADAAGEYPAYAGGVCGVVNGYVYDCVEAGGDVAGKASGVIFGALNPSGVPRGTVKTCTAYGAAEYAPVTGTEFDEAQITFVSMTEAGAAAEAIAVASGHEHFYHQVTFSPATCEDNETVVGLCAICASSDGNVTELEDTAAGHSWDEGVVTVPSTCSAEGERTFTCLKDPTHTKTEPEPIDENAHSWGEWTVTVPATEENEGQRQRVCAYDETHVETQTIPKLTHVHDLIPHEAVKAGCETDGSIAYYECTECGLLFADAEGAQEIFAEDTVVKATGHDWDDGVVIKPATCMEQGEAEYTCKNDNSHKKTAILPVDAGAHEWAAPTYVWAADYSSVTGRTVCAHNATHTYSETVTSSYEEVTPATELTAGKGVYTAHFSGFAGLTDQTETVVIEALGHDWGEATYVWSADNGKVTATRVCRTDASHVETETADTVYTVQKAATATETGVGVYTATFRNAGFETQTRTVVIDKLPTIKFVDVPDSAFYAAAVDWAVAHDPVITNGTDATHFSPNNKCTRAQVVTFLWRAAGCPEPASSKNPFTDVKSSAYYYKAVLWAVEKGVTSGVSADRFAPNNECTRGQVVAFLWRAKGSPAPKSTAHSFTDVKASGFYFNAMLWAVENGVTNGMTPTTFGPGKTCTRGQVVTFLHRAFE